MLFDSYPLPDEQAPVTDEKQEAGEEGEVPRA